MNTQTKLDALILQVRDTGDEPAFHLWSEKIKFQKTPNKSLREYGWNNNAMDYLQMRKAKGEWNMEYIRHLHKVKRESR